MPISRILVVEDYEPFRRFVCWSLQQNMASEIAEASDGIEGVEKALELQPDLILIDVGLPKLNGIEAARRIRQAVPNAKLLFVSNEFDSAVVQEAFLAGARGFVHKAFAFSDLLPAIRAVLAGARRVGNGLEFNDSPDASYRHAVQFYSDDAVLVKNAARFVGHSLSAADGVIVLATRQHQEGIAHRVQSEGYDVDAAAKRGTYIPLDAAETVSNIMVNGTLDLERFSAGLRTVIDAVAKAAGRKDPRVAIFGECVGLLWANGNTEAAINLERIGNELVATNNVDILCAYPWSHNRERDQNFESICAEHATVHLR